MKKKKTNEVISIRLGIDGVKCDKCLHVRVDEPYAFISRYRGGVLWQYDCICWRCCRDAESTELIRSKWPIAFVRRYYHGIYDLQWSNGVAELVAKNV